MLDTEGEPLRLGVEAEPFLVSPNQREAEALVGQEFHDDEDFRLALDQIAEMGARNVLITTETGCVALLREERESAPVPRGRAARRAGLDGRLRRRPARRRTSRRATRAGRTRSRCAPRSPPGAASTLEVGAGRFDPRQAGRLQAGVELSELEPVEA